MRVQFSLTTILAIMTALCVLSALVAFVIDSHIPWISFLLGTYLIAPLCAFYVPNKHRLLITAVTMVALLIGCGLVCLYYYQQMRATGLRYPVFYECAVGSLVFWWAEIALWYAIRQITGGEELNDIIDIPPISDRNQKR